MILMRPILFLYCIFLAHTGFAQLQALQYQDIQDFQVRSADLEKATIALNLRFYNPNAYAVDLKDGKIAAYLNDRFAGDAIVDERIKVPARDTFLLPLTIVAPMQQLIVNALDLLTNKEINVRLDGSIKAGRYGIFIRVPVRYEGKQEVSF